MGKQADLRSWPLTIFLFLAVVTPLPSIVLYVTQPTGTVVFFNGVPSPTASFWCSLTASG